MVRNSSVCVCAIQLAEVPETVVAGDIQEVQREVCDFPTATQGMQSKPGPWKEPRQPLTRGCRYLKKLTQKASI